MTSVLRDGAGTRGFVLAIDQGTTNTKVVLVDPTSGRTVARASVPVAITFPRPGSVEQDAAELWSATQRAAEACLAQAPNVVLAGVAVSNQRESVVAWDRSTGAPLGPVLGWQDARTSTWCAQLGRAGAAREVQSRTGLPLDAMYSAPKMRWLLDAATAQGADPSDVCLGTVDAWLVHNLTGGAVVATDAGNASRTLLFDLAGLGWSADLLEMFGIPASALPEVRPSDGGFGVTCDGGALPAGVPVTAVLADSHAALYHHGCTVPGAGKATYGTGSSVMTPCTAPDVAPEGITTTLAWLTDRPTYAREGNIVASGSALDWMAQTLGVDGGAGLTALAHDVDSSGGVRFVPAFSGLGAPYWDRTAQCVLVGVNGGTTRAHLARAALEAVAHQVTDVVEAIEADGGAQIATLHADGGATASGLLMQLQSDLLGRPVHVADSPDASALGVALLAARALGLTDHASAPWQVGGVDPVQPRSGSSDRAARRKEWRDAVLRSRGLPATATNAP